MKRSRFIITGVAALLLVAGLVADQKGRAKTAPPANSQGKCPACSFSAVQQPYESVRLALTANRLADAKKEAEKLRTAADAEARWAKNASGLSPQLAIPWSAVGGAAAKLARAESITDARRAFGESSIALRAALKIAGRDDVLVAYCPMVKLYWLQPKGALRNPYGTAMPDCGRVVQP